jgi:hypothetical protein
MVDLGKNITLNIYIKTQQEEPKPQIKELEAKPKRPQKTKASYRPRQQRHQ